MASYHGLAPDYYSIDSGFIKAEFTGYNLGILDYNLLLVLFFD